MSWELCKYCGTYFDTAQTNGTHSEVYENGRIIAYKCPDCTPKIWRGEKAQ